MTKNLGERWLRLGIANVYLSTSSFTAAPKEKTREARKRRGLELKYCGMLLKQAKHQLGCHALLFEHGGAGLHEHLIFGQICSFSSIVSVHEAAVGNF